LSRVFYQLREKPGGNAPGFFHSGALPIETGWSESLQVFVLPHYSAQNRFALLLEML